MWREWRGPASADAPAAVFLHGWPMDHRDEAASFDRAFAAAGYARLYCDLPGMGESADEPVPGDLDGYVDAIVRLIDAELGRRAFVLCGTSAGAKLAHAVAARLGDAVCGLVLRVPLVVTKDGDRRRYAGGALLRDRRATGRLTDRMRALIDDVPVLVEDQRWMEALARKMAATVIPAGEAANHTALDPVRFAPRRYAISARLPPFTRPALVMLGRQDEAVGWRDAMAAFGDWPRATIAILDMAGHEFPLAPQQPLLDALIADFLLRLDLAPGQTADSASDSPR